MSIPAPVTRPRRWVRTGGLAATGLCVAAALAAHETWLLPGAFAVPLGRAVDVDLTSGMAFPDPEHAITAGRVAHATVTVAGRTRTMGEPRPAPKVLRWRVTFADTGLARLAVSLRPRTLTLTREQVAHYLDEVAAPESVRARWAAQGPTAAWSETYRKHAVGYLRVAGTATAAAFAEPGTATPAAPAAPLALELVPLEPPLAPGASLRVRLLFEGAPLAGVAVGVITAGDTTRIFVETGDDGAAEVPLPRRGPVLLQAVHLRPAASGPGWESDFATLVLPGRRDP